MKLVIIGGSGFIGGYLRSTIGNAHEVLVIDKTPPSDSSVAYIKADVRDIPSLQAAIPADADWIVLLAAEHKDNVSPISLYYDVNVTGAQNVLKVMDEKGIRRLLFTSSVAIYGFGRNNPTEDEQANPENHYGKSKWEAEKVINEWIAKDKAGRTSVIIRPTVVFGPGNRGNVYNLIRQIVQGRFLMIGKGDNIKSMSYVENIARFIQYCLEQYPEGHEVFNYVDKPDLSTASLVTELLALKQGSAKKVRKIPYAVGLLAGYVFDTASFVLRRKLPISSVRIRKFCATTQFSNARVVSTGFVAPLSIKEGLKRTVSDIMQNDK